MKIRIEHELITAEITDYTLAQMIFEYIKPNNEPVQCASCMDNVKESDYLVITDSDITLNGKSTDTYNGEEIWCRNDAIEDFKKSIPLFKKESGLDVIELHVLQSSTEGNYAEPGDPVPDVNGKCCWCRIKTKDGKFSRWVFRSVSGSVAGCGSGCAIGCGSYFRHYACFRGSVFGSVGN